jgi:adenosylcobinamide-GDP ribazoletransferase
VREAISFLTSVGGARQPTARALRWFPAAGALIGLALGGLWWVADRAWPAQVAAALVVIADLVVTGMLHVDGLADAADGLLPHLPAVRRLQVMATPGVGAFGVTVTAAVLIARFAALAALRPAPLLTGGLWCLSRTGMAAVIGRAPYARVAGGLGTAFQGDPAPLSLVGAAAAAAVAGTCLWSVPAGAAAAAAAAAAFGGVLWLGWRRIGGYTGDVLGAAGVAAETAGLIVAAARW